MARQREKVIDPWERVIRTAFVFSYLSRQLDKFKIPCGVILEVLHTDLRKKIL